MASSHVVVDSDDEQKLLSKIDENVLLCAVCHDRFNVPKILSCQHSFCEQCLDVWVQTNGGRLTRPTCKQTSTLPPGGVSGIKNNRFINDLLEIIKEMDKRMKISPKCEGCHCEAKFWCNDCGQFFCDECVKSHSVVRSLKGHQLITMEDYKVKKESPDFRALRPHFCENHRDNKLEYFCDTCKVPVCLKCTVVEHVTHSHKIEPIEKSCKAQIPIIKKNITDLKQKANEVRLIERKTKAKIAEFKLNQSQVRKQIKAKISKLRDALEKEEKRLLGQVDEICKARGKQSDSNLEYLQNELASAESRCLYLGQLLIHGGPVDIVIAGAEFGKFVTATPAMSDLSNISTYIALEESSDCTILAGNVRSEQVRVNIGRNKGKGQMHKTAVKKGTRSTHAVKDTLSANTTHRAISATRYGYSCQPAFVAREAVSPVLVDINLYKFIKHTQGRRLESIETDCDVMFLSDETADTGMVTIQPNSHRTIPEQTQFARDQFVSLYDNH
ncbi:E3 ubiquitin-protein ligase TRIM56-like [Ptychodera flava]|uniref:E3 ubiquitin-protein ligase TRIM56-like n=1 Tax=Ptychodera flava TaxID=63121 RepID=UPI003969F283